MSWPLCSWKMSAISLPFCRKLGPVSQQRRGVALVSNGPAMALPFVCTSCPKDELGANEPGGVTASTQPYHPLHQPLNTALLRFSPESSRPGLGRSCQSSLDSQHQREMEAQRGEGPHLKAHNCSEPYHLPATEAVGHSDAPRALPLAYMLIYKGKN